MEGAELPRKARDPECAFAVEALQGAQQEAVYITPHDKALSDHTVAAYFTGAVSLHDAIDNMTYVPGAIVCNLTSFGATPQNFQCDDSGCPGSESQTSIARFVRAGATGVHGAVAEPTNNCFPNASALILYKLGYNLGESFFFSQRFLYWRNLVLGDPLATPYGLRPTVELEWNKDAQTIYAQAEHPNGISSIRLYLNGLLVETSQTETLEYQPPQEDPGPWDLMAVATATNQEQAFPNWPLVQYTPKTDTAGWVQQTLTPEFSHEDPSPSDAVSSEENSATETQKEATPVPGSGCVHHSKTAPASPLYLVSICVLIMLVRRGWETLS